MKRMTPPLLWMFDFDGVIADSLDIFHTSLADACRTHGYEQIRDRAIFLDIFDHNMVAGLLQLGIPSERITAILSDLGRRLATAMEPCQPFAGIPEAINRLVAQGPVYVVTSNLTAVVRAYLDRHGMHGVRDVLGSDRNPSKQAKIRALVAQWPALSPVYVGDTLGDMEEAHAAGVQAVAVTWGWHNVNRLDRGHPDLVLRSPLTLGLP